jgi:hypothetical protein
LALTTTILRRALFDAIHERVKCYANAVHFVRMGNHLDYLIEMARTHKITPEEHRAQVRSFAYGNTHFENETITRSDIDRAVDSLAHDEEPQATPKP